MQRKNVLKTMAIGCMFFMVMLPAEICGQTKALKKEMTGLIRENFEFAAQQYKLLMKAVPADSMPRTFEDGHHINSDTKWWCSGFYPGALLYIYEATKDELIKKEAIKRLTILEKEKHYTGNHDLGFMMFCSFGNAYAILKDPAYKPVIFTAAASLATRYRPGTGVIQSWNSSKKWQCPVIIDNMMNLELLEWTSSNGGGRGL